MKLAENIRYLRSQKGMSQTALAEALHLKRGNISSYEKGLAQPSIQNLLNISDYFNVSMEILVKEDLENIPLKHEENFLEKFSHSKWVKNIKEGVHALTNTPPKSEHIKKLKKKNKEIEQILEGFKIFHKHRMEDFKMDESTIRSISQDYENILKLLETILKSNSELIEMAQ